MIDGAAFAEGLRGRVAAAAARLQAERAIVPGLAVVLVGDDPASQVYVRSKTKLAREAGLAVFDHALPAETREADLLALVRRLNADPSVHGILVQLPLPKPMNADAVVRAIDPAKDVDGLHPLNAGLLASGQTDEAFVPCTPLGSLMLLQHVLGEMAGKEAVVIGRSILVGRPMAALLVSASCTVTTAHSRTRDLGAHCRRADILVAAIGKPRFVTVDMIKPGATIIDVGINRVALPDGKSRLVGDVDYDAVCGVAGAITPVPKGVGPMTIACLLANTVRAAHRAAGLDPPDWR